jgi:uncharacterized protein YegJ (DUF2314 family)
MSKENNWDKENIIGINVNGKSYVEAIAIAQEHLGYFVRTFEERENNKYRFFIKSRFEDENYIEHLWLMPTHFIGDTFNAIVNNVPKNLTNIKFEDVLQINKQDVEDWIIWISESEVLGNFIKKSVSNK